MEQMRHLHKFFTQIDFFLFHHYCLLENLNLLSFRAVMTYNTLIIVISLTMQPPKKIQQLGKRC